MNEVMMKVLAVQWNQKLKTVHVDIVKADKMNETWQMVQ